MSHTKEPWSIRERGNYGFGPEADLSVEKENAMRGYLSLEDARRIIACVNACANVPDSELVYGFPQLGSVAIVHSSFVDRFENTTKQRDDLQSQLKQVEALSEARLLQIGELKEQVECSNITEKNMEGRLNIATVKLAAMKEERDKLLVALGRLLLCSIPETKAVTGSPGAIRNAEAAIASAKGGSECP